MNTYDSTYTHKYQSFSCQFFNSIFCSCPSVTFYHFLNCFFFYINWLNPDVVDQQERLSTNGGLKKIVSFCDEIRTGAIFAQSVSFRFQVAVTPKEVHVAMVFHPDVEP